MDFDFPFLSFPPPPTKRELAEARTRIAAFESGYGLQDAMTEIKVRRDDASTTTSTTTSVPQLQALKLRLEQREREARNLTVDLNNAYKDMGRWWGCECDRDYSIPLPQTLCWMRMMACAISCRKSTALSSPSTPAWRK